MELDLLARLAENGTLGLLLVLCIFAIFYLYKQVNNEKKERMDDLKEFIANDVALKTEIKSFMQNIRDLLTGKK